MLKSVTQNDLVFHQSKCQNMNNIHSYQLKSETQPCDIQIDPASEGTNTNHNGVLMEMSGL